MTEPENSRRAADVLNIDLGLRLNHLLNESTNLGKVPPANRPGGQEIESKGGNGIGSDEGADEHNAVKSPIPGLLLPAGKKIGSGIVVVSGEPGSGKSTLGLQIAVTAARAKPGCDSAYISLEEEPDRIIKKAEIFGWGDYLWASEKPLEFAGKATKVSCESELASDPDWLKAILSEARRQKPIDPSEGRIILPGLLPRPLARSESRLTNYFWEQYRQIEFLVRSAGDHIKRVRRRKSHKDDITGIRLVVIDSLNMLGVESHNREMLHRLFDLFRQNQIMGVFTVESKTDIGFDSTMGDVVFNFLRKDDSGYEISILECTKSRFTKRTKGIHPYKIKGKPKESGDQEPGEVGIVVYPSPHAVVAATESHELTNSTSEMKHSKELFPFGWGDPITKHLLPTNVRRVDTVALAGPSGTFKTQIAFNFLLNGIANNESVLYLRLRTPGTLGVESMLAYGKPRKPKGIVNENVTQERNLRKHVRWLKGHLLPLVDEKNKLRHISSPTKVEVSIHTAEGKADDETSKLVVADFRTGMLLAEEFIDVVLRIFRVLDPLDTRKVIRRVVLDDVGSIGASYPLLKNSITSGTLFLSAFVHVMKNYNVSLLLLGTTGDYTDANQVVQQACSLADGVLQTRIGAVFGDRYVLLSGDGLIARQPNKGDTPPVVLWQDERRKRLMADARLLGEFVGFDSGRIQRPGIKLHLYDESPAHEDYYKGLSKRLEEQYGRANRESDEHSPSVDMILFRPGGIQRLQRSTGKAQKPPRDHTAIHMIDEYESRRLLFGDPQAKVASSTTEAKQLDNATAQNNVASNVAAKEKRAAVGREAERPCIRNVLLMAYNKDFVPEDRIKSYETWSELLELAKDLQSNYGTAATTIRSDVRPLQRRFCADMVAVETLACLVLDAIHTGKGFNWKSPDAYLTFPKEFPKENASSIATELIALHKLLVEHGNPSFPSNPKTDVLIRDSAIYVCWYSQLRDLLNRAPHMVSKLKLFALPGGGFTGDWYLWCEPGSVSLALGDTIKDDLRSSVEDFERFRLGLSLPVGEELEKCGLLAWPGSEYKAEKVMEFWTQAHRRSRVNDYDHFNRFLYGIGEILAGRRGDPTQDKTKDYIPGLVDRLPKIVHALIPPPKKTKPIGPI